MKTPICEFTHTYAEKQTVRAHMPGHKGVGQAERFDLTEIPGAGVLYAGDDCIAESEANAARLFGAGKTLYSTEGSSLCIRAMLYLARLHAAAQGRRPRILAGRNAHTVFLTAAALLDVEVDWLMPEDGSALRCVVTPQRLAQRLAAMPELPTAVYITSPDYLGNMADIAALAEVCHAKGCLLLVDNAHGAYLRFLPEDLHPMACGADLCCDSAHKTLPVLTGGAYLHLSKTCPSELRDAAQSAMRLFASTSPSYLILQSLDALNPRLEGEYPVRLAECSARLARLRERLAAQGFHFAGDEPMKLTIDAGAYGYFGPALASLLREAGIECEFADPDYVVLMLSPENAAEDYQRIEAALCALPQRTPITRAQPPLPLPQQAMPLREALFLPSELLPTTQCEGRILAQPSVSCPPAVPLALCGERLTKAHLALFADYGVDRLHVVKNVTPLRM